VGHDPHGSGSTMGHPSQRSHENPSI
jgi:hypothetical protein